MFGSSTLVGAGEAPKAVPATPNTRKDAAKTAITFFFIGISSLFKMNQN
jgi:hypothetical protein